MRLAGTLYDGTNMSFYDIIYILAGGIPTPLKNDGVKVSWDDFPFPTVSGKSFKIPLFQSTKQYPIVIPIMNHRLTIINHRLTKQLKSQWDSPKWCTNAPFNVPLRSTEKNASSVPMPQPVESRLSIPIQSHRIHGAGIYANIWGILMVNVTIYSIHGSYGNGKSWHKAVPFDKI